jgi:hypothetical protein
MLTLAESLNYRIESEYETVYLIHSAGHTVIGDFYGDPTAAIIDNDERWCAIVGCGMVLYYLKQPFEPYEYHCTTKQWVEFHRTPPDDWWIEEIEQIDKDILAFTVDPASDEAGKYQMNINNLIIKKVE